jgi:hypothetical protein
MDIVFIGKGHGYEISERGRCEAFDPYEIIAAPLGEWSEADSQSRVWPGKDGSAGVTYASHAIKLARPKGEKPGRSLYILMHHGGGREIWRLAVTSSHAAEVEAALLALPERTQYAMLYMVWSTARTAREQAQRETRHDWATAHVEKRIKIRRANNRRYVEIRATDVTA